MKQKKEYSIRKIVIAASLKEAIRSEDVKDGDIVEIFEVKSGEPEPDESEENQNKKENSVGF